MVSRLPPDKEIAATDKIDAWLKSLDDEYVAALLKAAAEHIDRALNTTRDIRLVPVADGSRKAAFVGSYIFGAAECEWMKPLIAAKKSLVDILEAIAAFEDALKTPARSDGRYSAPRPSPGFLFDLR
jgi:hypothetical protein